jgi:hypothetical protein
VANRKFFGSFHVLPASAISGSSVPESSTLTLLGLGTLGLLAYSWRRRKPAVA